jgi:hypothetical protein
VAAVKIHTGVYPLDQAATTPRSAWPELVRSRRLACGSLKIDCRALLFYVEDAAKNDWLGYPAREDYLRQGLELEPETVAWALDGLRQLDREQRVPFDEAVVLGQRGGDRRSEKVKDQVSTGNLNGGNNINYTLARLRRDRPDLAKRVAAGELSANAAAIEAGFRRRSITLALDPAHFSAAIRKHFTAEQRAAIIADLDD